MRFITNCLFMNSRRNVLVLSLDTQLTHAQCKDIMFGRFIYEWKKNVKKLTCFAFVTYSLPSRRFPVSLASLVSSLIFEKTKKTLPYVNNRWRNEKKTEMDRRNGEVCKNFAQNSVTLHFDFDCFLSQMSDLLACKSKW